MKVRNNKNKKEYSLTEEQWNKLKVDGKAGRFTIISDEAKKGFVPRELKIESQPAKKNSK